MIEFEYEFEIIIIVIIIIITNLLRHIYIVALHP